MKQENVSLWKCLLAGLAAGFVNGFFGAGGGMVLVPLLIWLVGLPDKLAFSSAISIILPLCLVSLAVYARQGALTVAWPYLVGGFAGGLLGGWLLRRIPVNWLHRALGLVILYGGLRLLLGQ